jgi:hypothetical protein
MINKIKQYKKQLIITLAILIAFGVGLSLSSTHTVIVEKEVIKTVEKNVGVTQTQYDKLQADNKNLYTLYKQCQTSVSNVTSLYIDVVQAAIHATQFAPDASMLLQAVSDKQVAVLLAAKECDPSMSNSIDWAKATR